MEDSNPIRSVSVIIPVRNRPQDIARCLDSLFKLDFPKESYEIIVVDNNSTDNTKEVIQRYPVRYVFEPRRGRGAARNTGVQASQGKYLAFIDSDCIAEFNWLSELVKSLEENPQLVACGGRVLSYKSENLIERYFNLRFRQEKYLYADEESGALPSFVTTNAVIRRETIIKIGYFDSGLITCEDTDLCWRLVLSGYEIGYAPKAIVYHRHIANILVFLNSRFELGKAFYSLLRKYDKLIFSGSSSNAGFIIGEGVFFSGLPNSFFSLKKKYKGESGQLVLLFLLSEIVRNVAISLYFILEWLHIIKPAFHILDENLVRIQRGSFSIALSGLLLRLSSETIWFSNNGSIKLINIKDNYCYRLNAVSSRIWRVLCDTKDLAKAIQIISREYQIPEETVSQDIQELLGRLEKEKLLVKS